MSDEQEPLEHEDGLQMSFLDHLDELRKRLIQSAIGVSVAFLLCFAFSGQIYNFLSIPVKKEARKARLAREAKLYGADNREVFAKDLKEGDTVRYTYTLDSYFDFANAKIPTTSDAPKGTKIPAGTTILIKITKQGDKYAALLAEPWVIGKTGIPAGTVVPEVFGDANLPPGFDTRDELVINRVGGAFSLFMQVSMYSAIAFAIPFLLYQIWAFVSPGLYEHEKKYIVPVLGVGTVLFIGGAAFAYYIAFPQACNFLLGWQEGFQTLLTADDYLDLILLMMLGFGLVFQIPTVAFILGRIGLITAGGLLKIWRYAIVAIMIIAAVVTPTPDPVNMMILAAPMLALYFLSVGVVWIFGKPRQSDEEFAASEAGG